eukprot:CAMPEP_0204629780 /NCGR_PEP_ID=MMETSP0717-20131115/18902_1 /ASSEMBLY_ACC=CAM_ASM_000666 /TAXON_ID=230516 /ORGANISM="Chaetoceros curvisetus" /LENGTH=119 /DNA_ID=CAMNT_0051646821 /DNA_START=1 /DNA_END=360 /DNA_ORIENTATION=+
MNTNETVDIFHGIINFITGKTAAQRMGGHCNKFFPFTHGQLQSFDPETYSVFQELWAEIAQWEDPHKGGEQLQEPTSCILFPCMRNKEQKKDSILVEGRDDYMNEYTNTLQLPTDTVYL